MYLSQEVTIWCRKWCVWCPAALLSHPRRSHISHCILDGQSIKPIMERENIINITRFGWLNTINANGGLQRFNFMWWQCKTKTNRVLNTAWVFVNNALFWVEIYLEAEKQFIVLWFGSLIFPIKDYPMHFISAVKGLLIITTWYSPAKF